jgi:hypothetical protein
METSLGKTVALVMDVADVAGRDVEPVSPEMYSPPGQEKGRPDRSSRPFEAPTKKAYASSSPSIS